MGATHSEFVERELHEEDPFWPRAYLTNQSSINESSPVNDEPAENLQNIVKLNDGDSENVKLTRDEEMEKFRKELSEKRKARQEILTARINEMQQLKDELSAVKKENELLKKNGGVSSNDMSINEIEETEIDKLKIENRKMMSELAELQFTLQNTNSDLLVMTEERNELQKHIVTFRDVTKVTKEMLAIREGQLEKLKGKLSEIEQSLADKELQTLSTDLRSEYERQLNNIRNLRTLYEERARVTAQEKQNLMSQIDEQKSLVEAELRKTKDLEERIQALEEDLSNKDSVLKDTESQLGFSKAETRSLQAEMTVVNQLFSQMLLCGGSKEIDMDRLVVLLQENHGLLSDMAGTEDEGTSAMPRLLLDLVSQAEKKDKQQEQTTNPEDTAPQTTPEDSTDDTTPTMTSAEDIVTKLPKVWRVLMELLSHQSCVSSYPETEDVPDDKGEEESNKTVGGCCYNSVQTPSGPRAVLSVSKTYIRLKDLILEKKSLQKELSRLKQLNNHLETRLESQERRLGRVSLELSHTWRLVGRMQNTHRTLHTHEQILRYELQQKRKLLTELKEELRYCREKWDEARQRNDDTEVEWKKLRLEFAARKKNDLLDQASGESGYSDEREGISSDEDSSDKDLDTEETNNNLEEIKEDGATGDIVQISRSRSTSLQPVAEVYTSTTEEPTVLEDKTVRTLEKKVFESSAVCVSSETEASTSSGELPIEPVPELPDVLESDAQNASSNVIEPKLEDTEVDLQSNSVVVDDPQSSTDSTTPPKRTPEEVLEARDARLKRLEEQCKLLVNKVTNTSHRGVALCSRLEVLHEQYGGASTSGATGSNSETTPNNTDECSEDDKKETEKTESVIKEPEVPGSSEESICDGNMIEEDVSNEGN